ncbi:ATP-binding cassette domain-containing protein [Radiobacillus kanasensis]|uniref:ribosomal protection-like ABC-F family protein n=1 Tax=Radiobacillus kanasensis TaxID=2844358 RepID=UPI001E584F8E|nr:ABC-F family ATP-binding cassette domain-containing protein [Radiobacillus kanasensis]UFU00450.1 ATP-binding cassette domain-containing protein [Radiobacillus kanasensis]
MRLLHAKDIKFSIGNRDLLNIPELSIHTGERIGLVGRNGQGKSMLLKYLLGMFGDESIVEQKGQIGYFEQLNNTNQVDSHLSGGEKTMQKLAELFSESAKIWFLDEPSNNLDWKRVEELEGRLQKVDGAMVIVSHDRALLDKVCHIIWELENGVLTEYNGNYSFYQKKKELEIEQQYQAHEGYLKEKKRLEERMAQKQQQASGMRKPPSRMGNSEWQLYKNKAAGKQKKVERVSKVIQKRLDRLEKVEKPEEWESIQMDFTLYTPIHRRNLLMAESLSKNIGDRTLYKIPSLKLKTGSKTAIIGRNGIGKTTLIHQLLSGDPTIDVSNNLKVGHFDQAIENLPLEPSVYEYVSEGSHLPEHVIRAILGRMYFKGDTVYKPIDVLSGGERVKVALAKLLVGDYNLLVLDEPTNHLDIHALQAVEGLINDYPGTVLLVSHDRTFVDQVANCLWILEEQTVLPFQGTLKEYEDSLAQPTYQANDEDQVALLALKNKLTDVISRLSLLKPHEDKEALEKEYEELLGEIRRRK